MSASWQDDGRAVSVPRRVDVAVIGGGPAGSVAAVLLARSGASVVVIERGNRRGRTVGESLPPAATPLLRDLGVWERFLADNHLRSYGNRSIWGGPQPDDHDFLVHPEGVGWHLDRPRFDALLADAGTRAGVGHVPHARVVHCRREGRGWSLSLACEDRSATVRASIVVDASGRVRLLARAQGVRCRVYDHLVGAVAVLVPDGTVANGDEDSFTLIEAVRDGWWYALRIPDDRLVVVYMTDADIAVSRRARTPGGWRAALADTHYIRPHLLEHGYRMREAPHLVAADSSCLADIGGNSWCAVGDAAAAYDPLSSFGITAALAGGQQVAQALLAGDGAIGPGTPGLAGYTHWLRHRYAAYLARWLSYYALEQRWPRAVFWQRRHAALADLLRTHDPERAEAR